jgi:ribokinase
MPGPGEIIHAVEAWDEAGGGGAVSAVQLAKLASTADFFTTVGGDNLGRRAQVELALMNLRVHAGVRKNAQRRAITYIDGSGDRSITVLGARSSPSAADDLPWELLEGADAVYLTAGDVEAVRLARRAKVLVATSRILPLLNAAGVELDALVGSSLDPSERYVDGDLFPVPKLVVRSAGESGGTYQVAGEPVRTFPATPLPGPLVDTYGCGDSFAAGLTFGLGMGLPPEKALNLAAMCGAAVATGRGPYPAQLTRDDLPGLH